MKKITLSLMAALVTVGATAGGLKTMPRHTLPKALHSAAEARQPLLSPVTTMQAKHPSAVSNMPFKPAQRLNAMAKAEEDATQEDALPYMVTTYTYQYDENVDAFLIRNMYVVQAQVDNGKAQLALFGLNPIEGVVEKGSNSMMQYAEEGERVDSITFSVGTVVYTEEDGTNYVIGLADINYNKLTRKYDFTRFADKTFGAYYYPDNGQIYVPGNYILALFPEDTSVSSPAYGLALCMLQLYPLDDIRAVMLKGTYSGQSYGGNPLTGDIRVVPVTSSDASGTAINSYYIAGFDPISDNAWLCFEQSADGFTATLDPDQFVDNAYYYTDETETDYFNITFTNFGYSGPDKDGYFTPTNYEQEEQVMGQLTYLVTVDNDENITLESDGSGNYFDYGFAEPDYDEDNSGLWAMVKNLKLNITSELLHPELTEGIKDASTNALRVLATECFDLQGRHVTSKHQGMTICKTRLADGSTRSSKVIRK